MANYYTLFSAVLELDNDNERAWWLRNMAISTTEEAYRREGLNEYATLPDVPNYAEVKLFKQIVLDEGNEQIDFDWKFNEEGAWFYSEENGSVWQVACYVSAFLREMRPNGKDEFVLQWADTCDKSRVDGFGGGVIVATKDGVGICSETDQRNFALTHINPIWG